MKASLWALILSVLLGASTKAQQPAIPPATNSLATNSPAKIAELRAKAEKGDASAQCALGACYSLGQAVPQDYAEAVKWFRKAAEQGNAAAQYFLGACYHNGQGVPQDDTETVKWGRKAADQGDAIAQCGLGTCYAQGQGVAQDYAEAVKWFRKAAEQANALAQFNLGVCYHDGWGVHKDDAEAVKWYRKAAQQGDAGAQWSLGICYCNGLGVPLDYTEAVQWYRKAAEQGNAAAQACLGWSYENGQGVLRDYVEAVNWYHKAADQGNPIAENDLGSCYANGNGVIRDYVQAYKWDNLASAQGVERAKLFLPILEQRMTPEQIAEAQQLAREFKPRHTTELSPSLSGGAIADLVPVSSGTGFFITEDGFLVTAAHVVNGATQIRLVTGAGLLPARLVKLDTANDFALLKAEGQFSALPIISSRSVKLGNTIATVGFPNVGLQGFSPKLAKGEIASLAGTEDDPRYFQISVPVQPGNSGGALVDERGNVIGVVAAKLNAATALVTSGALPENVNYAVKSSFLLGFLESAPSIRKTQTGQHEGSKVR